MRKFTLLIAVLLLCSFSDTSLKKRISDIEFRYEFYTTTKNVNPKKGRDYYWFKGGTIHSSEYGSAGELLHDDFKKYYHSNQLAENGKFDDGLKDGTWKNWYENGTLKSETYWNNGFKDGDYYLYDPAGVIVEKGSYRNNLKNGRWINYITKDTLKYHNGSVVLLKEKKSKKAADSLPDTKPSLFKRLLGKKEKKKIKEQEPSNKQNITPEKRIRANEKVKSNSSLNNTTDKPKRSFISKLFTKEKDGKKTETPVNAERKKSREESNSTSTQSEKNNNFWGRLFKKKNKK